MFRVSPLNAFQLSKLGMDEAYTENDYTETITKEITELLK